MATTIMISTSVNPDFTDVLIFIFLFAFLSCDLNTATGVVNIYYDLVFSYCLLLIAIGTKAAVVPRKAVNFLNVPNARVDVIAVKSGL
jgi:hypothetical protein